MARGYMCLTFEGAISQAQWARMVESFRTHAEVMGFPLADLDVDLDD